MRRVELTEGDVLRLRSLGVRSEPETLLERPENDADVIAALNGRIARYFSAMQDAERRAAAARREAFLLRAFLLLAGFVAAAFWIADSARRGGW